MGSFFCCCELGHDSYSVLDEDGQEHTVALLGEQSTEVETRDTEELLSSVPEVETSGETGLEVRRCETCNVSIDNLKPHFRKCKNCYSNSSSERRACSICKKRTINPKSEYLVCYRCTRNIR